MAAIRRGPRPHGDAARLVARIAEAIPRQRQQRQAARPGRRDFRRDGRPAWPGGLRAHPQPAARRRVLSRAGTLAAAAQGPVPPRQLLPARLSSHPSAHRRGARRVRRLAHGPRVAPSGAERPAHERGDPTSRGALAAVGGEGEAHGRPPELFKGRRDEPYRRVTREREAARRRAVQRRRLGVRTEETRPISAPTPRQRDDGTNGA